MIQGSSKNSVGFLRSLCTSFRRVRFCACVLLCIMVWTGSLCAQAGASAGSSGSSAPSAADRALAGEEFRRGVQSFYRGAFNDSIMLFEKSLSWLPGEPLILDWLGKAYYRTGTEGAALQQWAFASAAGYGSILLKNRMEVVRERRTVRPSFDESARFVEAASIPSRTGDSVLFRQPVSMASSPDGSFWAVAYGSNEVLHFDVNGSIVGRFRGPIGGFDRPFDLLRLRDGRMLVSEVGADRISVLSPSGAWLSSFGKKGRGTGELLGPQYLAVDSSGNVFVTDFGNARVVVFDADGNGLFSFGSRSVPFPGFKAPVGIAIIHDTVYVADSITGELHSFDTSGNFIETFLPRNSLTGSESIRVWNGYLLVSMPNRVLLVDPDSGSSFDAARLGNAPVRITSAVPDANGNLLLADYRGESIQIVSRVGELVGGMFVQIERVLSDSFPAVALEIRVEDRNRNPVVGLKASNFLVTEESRPVSSLSLAGAGYLDDYCDITVLIDRSLSSDRYLNEIKTALAEISRAMKGKGTLRIVSAGSIPVQEGSGPPDTGAFSALALKAKADSRWRFDLGLRLAVNDLVNAAKKRAVVYLSTGEVSASGFLSYGLNDLAAYMGNNGVLFSVVQLAPGAPAAEYAYLSHNTGGSSYYVYRNEGLSGLVSDVLDAPNGSYVLTYTSTLPTDFGRAYLPVEVEAWLMNRSGKDETGYFAPLE